MLKAELEGAAMENGCYGGGRRRRANVEVKGAVMESGREAGRDDDGKWM